MRKVNTMEQRKDVEEILGTGEIVGSRGRSGDRELSGSKGPSASEDPAISKGLSGTNEPAGTNELATSKKPASSKERSRRAFDQQASSYDSGMQGSHARMLYPHVVRAVAWALADVPLPRILDVGCGTGALAEQVLAEVPSAKLTGVDLAPKMVEQARRCLGSRALVVQGDAERLPFHDGMFDLVYCNDSFHHYPDPERAAFQMWRVLVPGGTLVIGDIWQPAPARAVMNAWMPHSHEGDVHMYSEPELRTLLGAWFEHVSWQRIGFTACLCVARK